MTIQPINSLLLLENYPVAHYRNNCCSESNETFLGSFHRDHSREKVEDPYSPEQKQQINGYILKLNEILLKHRKETVQPEF